MFAQSRRSNHFVILLVSLGLGACAGGDQLSGTWQDTEATTALPATVGGGLLDVDATFVLDEVTLPGTFDMHLDLSFEGLADTVDASGTYDHDGAVLTFTFTEFTIDETSSNSAFVSEEGAQCLNLMGFGGAPVCFPTPQENPYTLEEDTLTVTIEQAIAGAAVTDTQLALTPVP